MNKETPIETLNYYTLIISKILDKPMSRQDRRAVASDIAAKLPESALHDLYGKKGMIAALTSIETVLREPHLVHKPKIKAQATAQPS